VRVAYIMH